VTTQGALLERIAARIRREGPITFAEYMALALYDERDGFFASCGGAGRAGRDFVTSPEVGSLFGALIARHLDRAWAALGEPDPFVVVECGAGHGRLAADVLRAAPACLPTLRYVLVEKSAELRALARERLPLEPADEALGPFVRSADPDDAAQPVPHAGPIVTAIGDLPALHVIGVVFANELLDNLPARVVERAGDAWREVRVGATDDDRLCETIVPAPPDLAIEADHVAAGTEVPDGMRLPVPIAAVVWLAETAALVRRGEIVLIDYMATAAELIERGQRGWLRTYRAHDRGAGPLDAPGTQDITCDVPLEYLRTAATRAGQRIEVTTDQATWLRDLGIDDLVAEGDATWRERAGIGDLAAVAGRSRGVEAAALTDRSGLGAHRVVVLRRR
jgi:SAM-dependent MidA family methyltransferase